MAICRHHRYTSSIASSEFVAVSGYPMKLFCAQVRMVKLRARVTVHIHTERPLIVLAKDASFRSTEGGTTYELPSRTSISSPPEAGRLNEAASTASLFGLRIFSVAFSFAILRATPHWHNA